MDYTHSFLDINIKKYKMRKTYCSSLCYGLLAAILMLAWYCPASAQYLRTSYFMENSQYRLQLNPALAPTKGFVHLPGIGHVNAAVRSNTLGFDDVLDIIENSDDADYFASERFMNNLKDENRALINAETDVLAVGWWQSPKAFWTISMSVKVDGDMNVQRGLFSFMRDMRGMENNDYSNYVRDMGQQELNVNAYSEIAVGYTHRFSDRFSAGLRVKGLLGLGNARLKVNKAVVKTNLQNVASDIDWSTAGPDELMQAEGTASVEVDATLESSIDGLDFKFSDRGYIDDMKYETKHMGIGGVGAGIDVGVEGRVVGGLSLSAALVDVGFIKWSRGSTTVAHSNTSDLAFDSNNPGDVFRFSDVVGTGETLNMDMLRLYIDEGAAKSRTTHLNTSMVLGADYAFVEDKISVGVLYTNYFARVTNESELTFSFNYKPSNLVGLTASYSPLLCGGKSFGVGLKLGPLFVGTDYMFTGMKTKCCNALFGLSIPLGRRQDN